MYGHPVLLFFFNDTATTEIYTLSLHDALPIFAAVVPERVVDGLQPIEVDQQQGERPVPEPGELDVELTRLRDRALSLLLIDFDGLKAVNDALGYDRGEDRKSVV